jgi:predicted permease
MDAYRETMRDERGARWFDDLGADLRYALRAMRKSPGFAIAVALTLGIGIGVNGMVFGYVNSILFRPLPASDPSRLVGLFVRHTRSGAIDGMGYVDYVDYRDRSGIFSGLAAAAGAPLNLVVPGASGATAADMVWGEMVTENYFSVLGMHAARGRFFSPADAPQGANTFAVLSYESWQNRFAADPDIAGRTIRLNGTPFTVTGVAPRGFRGMRMFGFWPEIFVPIGMHEVIQPGSSGMLDGRGFGPISAFGRMRADLDRQRTAAAVDAFARGLEQDFPASNADLGALITPARNGVENPAFVKPTVLVLSSALGSFAALLTLLVICANLANLQLARLAARAKEIAIRLSVGCSRARLSRQLLVESAVLALPGLVIAAMLVRLNELAEPYLTPRLQFHVGLDARIDHRVMLFTTAIALFAVILVGLIPATRASRRDLRSLAGLLGRDANAGSGRPPKLRSTLVVAQLALSVVLLVGGTLFVRSLLSARTSDVGFDPSGRAVLSLNVGLQGYDESRGRRFYESLLQRTRELPDVVSASFVFPAPFDTYDRSISVYVEGLVGSADGTISASTSVVGDDIVRALGLRLHGGRDFTAADSAGAPLVAIASRSLANRLWPGRDPIGIRFRRGDASGPETEIVGVVEDATFILVGGTSRARLYLPLRQRHRDWETLLVHTRGSAAAIIPRVREVIATIDPALPTFGATTMEQAVSSGFATSRSAASVAGFFGLLALLIACVGLYAVVAASVAERTREIGVRLALGATRSSVLRHIMRGGIRLGVIGLTIGLAGAFAVSRTMAGLLYGVSPADVATFLVVPFVLGLVVIVATYLPARRALRLDPIASLRSE